MIIMAMPSRAPKHSRIGLNVARLFAIADAANSHFSAMDGMPGRLDTQKSAVHTCLMILYKVP